MIEMVNFLYVFFTTHTKKNVFIFPGDSPEQPGLRPPHTQRMLRFSLQPILFIDREGGDRGDFIIFSNNFLKLLRVPKRRSLWLNKIQKTQIPHPELKCTQEYFKS